MFLEDVAVLNVRLVTPPAGLPVSLAEVKAHLRVDHDDDDALIEGYIEAAAAHLDAPDGRLGIVLSPRTFEMALDRLPTGEIELPIGPVQSVESITYVDADGAQQTVSAGSYTVDTFGRMHGWIVPLADFAWPETMDVVNAVRVRWVAGGDCPHPIRQFIKLIVGKWYADREADIGSIDDAPFGLIAPWRAYR